jgi:hypothetical protein
MQVSQRSATGGIILVVLGAFLLLMNLSQSGAWGLLAAGGAVLLMTGLVRNRYALVLPGCLITAIGVVIWLENTRWTAPLDGSIAFPVGLGVGFLAIYLLGRRWDRWWPLLPGIVLVWMGAVPFSLREMGYAATDLGSLAGTWPLLLVVPGLWLLARPHLKGRASVAGRVMYVALLMVAVLLVVTGVSAWAAANPLHLMHPPSLKGYRF